MLGKSLRLSPFVAGHGVGQANPRSGAVAALSWPVSHKQTGPVGLVVSCAGKVSVQTLGRFLGVSPVEPRRTVRLWLPLAIVVSGLSMPDRPGIKG